MYNLYTILSLTRAKSLFAIAKNPCKLYNPNVMKNAHAKIFIVLAFVLLLVVAGLFACVYHTAFTAYGDSTPSFSIVTTTGQDWQLKYEGVLVQELTGNFFNYEDEDDENQPAIVFKNLIQARLEALSRDPDDYTLTFNIPTPTITFKNDMDSNPYTELNDSQIIVQVSYMGILSSPSTSLEYKPQGADDSEYVVFPTIGGNELRFGQSVDKGDYEVRVKVGANFQYLGRPYSPTSVSTSLVCHITDADLPDSLIHVPESGELSFEYGWTLAEIASRISANDQRGTWTIAAPQDPTTKLSANDIERTVYMDFESINQNYNERTNVAVPLTVTKRRLSVYVDSVDRIKGQPLVTNIGYSVDSTLVEGDTLESIGFKIDTSEVDVNTEGEYPIFVRVTNPNYNPITRNYETQHVLHSFYRVHSDKVHCTFDDFRSIIVARPDGFIGMKVVAGNTGSLFDETDSAFEGMTVIANYVLFVTDNDDHKLSDLGDISVTLDKRPDDYAVAYEHDGKIVVIVLDENMTFTLPNDVISFAVLKKNPEPYAKTVEWNASLTALSILIMLFTVAIWVVVVLFASKRRLLK